MFSRGFHHRHECHHGGITIADDLIKIRQSSRNSSIVLGFLKRARSATPQSSRRRRGRNVGYNRSSERIAAVVIAAFSALRQRAPVTLFRSMSSTLLILYGKKHSTGQSGPLISIRARHYLVRIVPRDAHSVNGVLQLHCSSPPAFSAVIEQSSGPSIGHSERLPRLPGVCPSSK